jgi:RNA polymerase sigma-70 factor (ECF subfamily)
VDTSQPHSVTRLLQAWSAGDEGALQQLTPLVYQELHRAAHCYMARERSGHTLQATALINEVYVRLIGSNPVNWQNRAHFLAVCAQMMRRILIDFARSRGYQKRGEGTEHLTLDEGLVVSSEPGEDLVALDDSLRRLARVDKRKGQVVELRFFGGLDVDCDTAKARAAYQNFLTLWKDADPDIPILQQAKAEYAKLR